MYSFNARSRILPALALASVLGLALAAPSFAQGGTSVKVSPASSNLACDATQVVDIRINDVENLFGVDIRVSFDANVLEVVDADANAASVNITPGDLPAVANNQGMIQTNRADNDSGIVSYAAIRVNPAPAQSGNGVIAQINFKGKASGSSAITLESVMLANASAGPIAADLSNGTISVTCDGQPRPTRPAATDPAPTTAPPGRTPGTPRPTLAPVRTPGSGGGGYGKPTGCSHVIKLGETLYSIARLHGISVASLAAANGIHNPDYIRAGQTLTIPGCGGHGGPGPVVPPGGNPGSADCWTYIVKPGDTLSGIAWSTGDSVAGIASRNGILNPERIYAGKGLTVCSGGYGKPGSGGYPGKPGGKCRFTYVVKPGESLSGIAWRYGMASYALTAANGLSNPNLIYAGQVLCIP